MDDAGDLVLVEGAPERVDVGDVALHERHAGELLFGQDEPEAGVVTAEVVADRVLAVVEESLDRPGAEAAERARDERPALRQAARPGRR